MEPAPIASLSCGAVADEWGILVCPDPYCRVCRDETGEARDLEQALEALDGPG